MQRAIAVEARPPRELFAAAPLECHDAIIAEEARPPRDRINRMIGKNAALFTTLDKSLIFIRDYAENGSVHGDYGKLKSFKINRRVKIIFETLPSKIFILDRRIILF